MGLAIGSIIIGLIVALFGRRLYWIFVALAGFSIGWSLAPAIFGSLATWAWVLIGAVLGIIFALLSIRFTKFMVKASGFFAFGPIGVELVRWLGATASSGSWSWWVAYIVGGLIGAALLIMLFDWMLVILTAVSGAGAVAAGVGHWSSARWTYVILWIVVLIIGISYQFVSLKGAENAPRRVKARSAR